MYDTSPGGQTAVQYNMATQTVRTPSATSPYHISMPRPIRHTKSTTPATSPRAACSVGQAYPPPLTSPKHVSEERVPSPNYFGLVLEPSEDPHDSSMPSKGHWSPATSSIKSFTAALPKPISLDPNPEFEAFKRQVDRHRGLADGVPTSPLRQTPSQPGPIRPRPSRWHTHHAPEAASRPHDANSFRLALNKTRALLQAEKDTEETKNVKQDDTPMSPPQAAVEAKRNSDSMLQANLTPIAPMLSPGLMDFSPAQSQNLTPNYSYDARLSLIDNRFHTPSPQLHDIARATTLPTKIDQSQQGMITAAQLADIMTSVPEDMRMLIDIRSMQNFSQSRIKGALNICIPTTLLKRATFNIEKLQQTFQGRPEADKFAQWNKAKWIVVYDSHTTDGREAITAQNMMKKFTSAGFEGQTGILRGGFNQFRESFPDMIDTKSSVGRAAKPSMLSLGGAGGGGGLAPVIGGVSLPAGPGNQNAFFSNIRQNVDLADGVGQFDVARPEGVDAESLPQWLQTATSPDNHGKAVSDKFLNIELDEQKRMRSCYAAFNPQHDKSGANVQLCGVEKGVKNRYKDILPFEHARVRLQNKPEGSCDYVNASHLSTAGSNKKYIASQGPLPATFEDFWSMVWDQDVRVIVMLTATTEGGQLKCHPYWEGREFGPVKLKPLSEKKASLDMDRHRSDSTSTPPNSTNDPGRRRANTTTTFEAPTPSQTAAESTYVVIRKFAISHADHPFAPMREITHLHFPGWPDFGTPTRPSHLLALIELANMMQRAAMPVETGSIVESRKVLGETLPTAWYDAPEAENSRPMLVHCSAGCGRTGAFCTVDTVIDMLKRRRQSVNNAGNATDGEGDIAMTDIPETISPMSNSADADGGSYFQQSFNSLDSVVKMQSQAGLDKTWISDESIDLVQKTVRGFREQRLSMVQSLRQYVLCYETILEWVHRTRDKDASLPTGSQRRKRSGSLTIEL